MPTSIPHVLRRAVVLVAVSLAAASCSSTIPGGGGACRAGGACPDGQACGTDSLCHDELCLPACPSDQRCNYDTLACEPIDDDDGGSDDTRAHVGFVRLGGGGVVLGTVVSPHLVLTCAACLAGAPADALAFEVRGASIPVLAVAAHPSADLAALVLGQTLPTPALDLATTAPASGVAFTAIAPSSASASAASGAGKRQVLVTVGAAGETTFGWTAEVLAEELLCAMVGGPTFAPGAAGRDVLVGLHTQAACAGGATEDLRIDVLVGWLGEQIDAAEPDTCPATGTCSGECGVWSCDDAGGEVTETCAPDEGACGAAQHCDAATLSCQPDAVCTSGQTRVAAGQCGVQTCSGGQWGATQAASNQCGGGFPTCSAAAGYACVCNSGQTLNQGECGVRTCSGGSYGNAAPDSGRCSLAYPSCDAGSLTCDCNAGQYLSCPGDGCGRRYCAIVDGNYAACSAYSAVCDSNESCVASGGSYACQIDECSTAGWGDCTLDPNPTPATVGLGASFETSTGCGGVGRCKTCTCNGDGSFTCGICYDQ